jgi:tetratricopeptide (TPR) repeat protein
MLKLLFTQLIDGARARQDKTRRASAADLERARVLQSRGDIEGARAACEGILSRDASHAGAHALLGALYGEKGDLEGAHRHFTAAVRHAPDLPDARLGLGNIYRLRGDPVAAAGEYRRALAANPDSAIVHLSLGQALRAQGEIAAALAAFERALELDPLLVDAAVEAIRGKVQLGSYGEALALARAALMRAPDAGELHAALGFVHQKMHDAAEALKCYLAARSLGHENADLYNNMGIVHQDMGRLDEALVHYERALALKPDFPLARFHRGLARLLMGDFANGWPDYEMRLLSEDLPRRPAARPRWEGSALTGRTLLVYGEQGLGDEIMFASCLPDVVAMAGRCVIECGPKLEAILRRSFPGTLVYPSSPDRLPPHIPASVQIDFEIPCGSLPLYLRRSVADFPRHDGYLKPDARRVNAWRERLALLGAGLKVGISWAGGTYQSRSPLRSIPLDQWLPILATNGVRWVSLQYGAAAGAREEVAARGFPPIEHWQEAIDDYEDTAALISALDLVISVQTAVVHLTGALGRPAWVMVSGSPEWRYGFAGSTMPWYPSVRVFRQPSLGEWEPVIAAVARDLHSLAEQRGPRS